MFHGKYELSHAAHEGGADDVGLGLGLASGRGARARGGAGVQGTGAGSESKSELSWTRSGAGALDMLRRESARSGWVTLDALDDDEAEIRLGRGRLAELGDRPIDVIEDAPGILRWRRRCWRGAGQRERQVVTGRDDPQR